ncbi:MAG: hypothetical protein ACLUSK_11760 [Bacteroides stercoris]
MDRDVTMLWQQRKQSADVPGRPRLLKPLDAGEPLHGRAASSAKAVLQQLELPASTRNLFNNSYPADEEHRIVLQLPAADDKENRPEQPATCLCRPTTC